MNEREKNIYRDHLTDYIKKVSPDLKPNDKKLIPCPNKCSEEPTAQLHHNKLSCYEPSCKEIFDIFDYVKAVKPQFKDRPEEEIADYLQHLLKIDVSDHAEELLQKYADAGFCLIPIAPESKRPTIKWKEKYYKNPKIWQDWLDRGWGLALRLGEESNVIAIDVDSMETHEKVKHLFGDTLVQSTSRGFHYLYNYDPEIKKTLNKVLRDDGYELEYRTEGAYIIIAPTSVNGETRKWNDGKITDMPKELKDFILEYYNKGVQEQTIDETIQEAITNETAPSNKLSGWDGCFNDNMTMLGGILRKKMPIDVLKYTLSTLNNQFENPMDNKSLYSLINQIDKYQHYDKEELAKTVLERLEIIKEGTAYQIASSLKIEVKDVEEVLKYLEDQDKVIPGKNRSYSLVNNIEWTTSKAGLAVPLDFEVPYFHDYARFNWGNMIIVGANTGAGKTHVVGNIIKKLSEQNIKPYLVSTEPDSNIEHITKSLGVSNHSYFMPSKNGEPYIVKHPGDIELVNNSVTIIDWLRPKNGDYAQTDNTLDQLNNQLKKRKGLLIVMVQLRKSNNEFFAPDQVEFYGALVAKYLWGNGGKDGENTYFKTQKIRDSRNGLQYIEIPMYFDRDKKTLEKR